MPVDLIAVVSHQIILSFSASVEVTSEHVGVDSEKRLCTFSLISRSKHEIVHTARVLKLSVWLLNKNKYNTEDWEDLFWFSYSLLHLYAIITGDILWGCPSYNHRELITPNPRNRQ